MTSVVTAGQVSTVSAIEPTKIQEFNKLTLEGLGTGAIADFHHLFRGLVVDTSLYRPYVKTKVVIEDAASLFETRLPILGEEKLTYTFLDANQSQQTGESYITNVSPVKVYEGRKMVGYILEGKSEQAINNVRGTCRETYSGTNYSDIAQDVASRWLKKPFDNVDATIKPPEYYYLQNMTPFQTLDILKRMSWAGYESYYTAYATFESGQERFNYQNIFNLMKKSAKYRFFVTDAMDEAKELEEMFVRGVPATRVLGIDRTNQFNTPDVIMSGWDSRTYQHVDIVHKNVTEVRNKASRPTVLAGKELYTGSYRGKYMSPIVNDEVRRLFNFTEVPLNDNYYRDKFLDSQPLIHALGQNEITIVTAGTTKVNVGEVVKMKTVKIDGYDLREDSVRYGEDWIITRKVDTIGFDNSFMSRFVLSRESVDFKIDKPFQPEGGDVIPLGL